MKYRPQLKMVAWGVSLALMASTATMPAFAGGWGVPTEGDTGQGVDTVIGNGLNPRGLDTTTPPDSNGLGPFHSPVAHTPTGAQYSVPWAEPADPNFYGDIEFGYIGSFGDANASKFTEYRDFSGITGDNNGLTINNFNFGSEKGGHYFRFSGGGVSNKDQYYTGAVGVYNDWRLRFFYNETPHVFQTDARLIWTGAGTNTLTLKPQFQQNLINRGGKNSTYPSATVAIQDVNNSANNGGNDIIDNALRDTIAQAGNTTIALYRKKGGFRWDAPITDKWNYYASYSVERRTGDRDFGQTGGGFPGTSVSNASANNQNGQPLEVVEPIDYTVHEFALGNGYADGKNALNVSITASIFQDAIKDVYWQNPVVSPYQVTTAPAGVYLDRTWEQFSTPPDNQAYNLNVDYSRALGFWNGNLNLSGSLGRQNQNDNLVPHTSASGSGQTGGAAPVFAPQLDMALWNSVYANVNGQTYSTLSRTSSGLHNNVSMFNLGANFQPIDSLSVGGKLRYYGIKNDNDYLACNPALAAAYQTTCAANGATSLANGATVAINGVNYTTAGIVTVGTQNYAPIYGYMGEDGNNPTNSTAYTANNRVRSFSGTFHQVNAGLNADYALASKQSLNLNYERENVYREMREFDWTYEDKFKLGYVNRGLGDGTLRASYEYDNRKHSDYKFQPYRDGPYCVIGDLVVAQTAGGCGLGTAATLTANPVLGSKIDENDRKQHTFILRYNYMFTQTLDGMFTGKLNIQKYPELLGRDDRKEHNFTAELNWTPDTLTNVYTALTYEGAQQSQTSAAAFYSNCTTVPCNEVIGGQNSFFGTLTTTVAGNTVFDYDMSDKDWYFTLGGSHTFSAVRVDANYVYTRTQTPIDYTGYNYATGVVGTANNGLGNTAAPTQFSFPTMTWNRHQLNLNATVPINDKLAIHALYMFDKATAADWHYDGLGALNDVTGNARTYLNSGGTAEPYTAHVFGLFAQYRM